MAEVGSYIAQFLSLAPDLTKSGEVIVCTQHVAFADDLGAAGRGRVPFAAVEFRCLSCGDQTSANQGDPWPVSCRCGSVFWVVDD